MMFRAIVATCLFMMVSSQSNRASSGLKKPACLKSGDLCIPMLMRVFGSQYANEAYCCNTTCVPLMPPMYGMCSRFLPQIASPSGIGTGTASLISSVQGIGTGISSIFTGGSSSSSSSSSSASSPSSDSRNNFLYYV